MGISEEVSRLLSTGCKEKFALHGSRKDDLQVNEPQTPPKRETSHKAILDVHTLFMRPRWSTDIKIPCKGSNSDLEHYLSEILATANSRPSSKRHHVGCHPWKMLCSDGWTLKPAFRQKGIRRRKYGRVSMHGPCLRRHNRPWGKGIAHHIVDFIGCSILGCRCRHYTFKKTRNGSV